MGVLGPDAFDFWLGEWDCTFEGGRAVNRLTREHEGNVIVERFTLIEPREWHGTSVSVYDATGERWRQTWVDDDGAYWAFVGTTIDGDPSFATPEPVDQPARFKRMVFSDIADDSFRWRWESSEDGDDWTVNWALDYRRR